MHKNLINIDWNKIEEYNESEISYFLFLEGKSIDAICKIRKLDKSTVQKHIIDGKIKYRFLVKNSNIKELFYSIINTEKDERILFIENLTSQNKEKLVDFIRKNYADMHPKIKEKAVWMLGEMKGGIDILKKASVHKFSNIRRLAISAMNKIEDKECEIALIRALEDTNSQVVLYALKALIKLKSEKAYNKILKLNSSEQKLYIKNAIEEYFKLINK